MSDATKIEDYLNALSRALRSLPERDRDDIVAEIRAHLEHRAGEGRLNEALNSLGSPESCARTFIDELKIQDAFADGGPTKTFGALLALASRRTTASVGLFVSSIFFIISIGFAFTAVAEIVTPDLAGFWVGPGPDHIMIGVFDPPTAPPAPGAPEPPREIMGRWLIPFAAGMAVLFFLVSQWLSRFFIHLMMRRKPSRAI